MRREEFTRAWRLDHVAFRAATSFDVDQARLVLIAYRESGRIDLGDKRQDAFAYFTTPDLPQGVVVYCEWVLIDGEIATIKALTGPVK